MVFTSRQGSPTECRGRPIASIVVSGEGLFQPFHVAEVFTGFPGVFVDLEDTIKGFKGVCAGDYDHLPEAAFYMVGTIEDAVEKAKRMAEEAA